MESNKVNRKVKVKRKVRVAKRHIFARQPGQDAKKTNSTCFFQYCNSKRKLQEDVKCSLNKE